MIEALVQEDEEYPIVCFGLKERWVGGLYPGLSYLKGISVQWFADISCVDTVKLPLEL